MGDRYWGLVGDAVASLWAGVALEKQHKVEEAKWGRIRVRYRVARDEYSRCRALGIPDRGYCVVARQYGIAQVLLRCFINREHQEGLDSMDSDEGSSNEESSTGDFKLWGTFFELCWCGIASKHGRVSPCTCLAARPTFYFFYITMVTFYWVEIVLSM